MRFGRGIVTYSMVCANRLKFAIISSGLDPLLTGTLKMKTHYTIIGGGRLARHFAHYFSLLGISYNQWQRSSTSSARSLQEKLNDSSHILLLISDSAISEFLQQHPFLYEKTIIHCSGAHSFPGTIGVHPLMTFGDDYYALDVYTSIPMVCEASTQAEQQFGQLFPQLNNPVYSIRAEDKALYHAYCVSAGNLSQIIQQLSTEGIQRLGLPAEILHPYLSQNLKNFISEGNSSLTGPLVRSDQLTIDANLAALKGLPMENIYRQIARQYARSQHGINASELAA